MTAGAAAARRAAPARSESQLRSLTGLRWGAAFVVFVYHVRNFGYFTGRSGRLVDDVFGDGDTGVSFFFVLSGFVLAHSARADDSAGRFWVRRLARIYPLHLVTALAAMRVAAIWPVPAQPRGDGGTAANLLLISSWWPTRTQVLNPVSWSLTCEAFFYVLFPLINAVLRRICRPWLLVALLIASLLVAIVVPWWATASQAERDLRFYPPARLPEFVVGLLLARLVAMRAWRGPGLLGAAAVLVAGYYVSRHVPYPFEFAACTLPGVAAVIAAAARRDLAGRRSIWSSPLLVRLGELSFAFYLVHIVVMRTAQGLPSAQPGAGLGLAAGVFAVSLGLACALNEFVEVPARRLILRLTRRRLIGSRP